MDFCQERTVNIHTYREKIRIEQICKQTMQLPPGGFFSSSCFSPEVFCVSLHIACFDDQICPQLPAVIQTAENE